MGFEKTSEVLRLPENSSVTFAKKPFSFRNNVEFIFVFSKFAQMKTISLEDFFFALEYAGYLTHNVITRVRAQIFTIEKNARVYINNKKRLHKSHPYTA